MSSRRTRPALPDWHLWTEVARTVSPLHRRTLLEIAGAATPLPLPGPPPPPKPLFKARKPPAPAPSYQSPGTPGKATDAYRIEPRMKRRLGRGQIDIDGTIDLHGMRQDEARAALGRFVTARAERGDRTILVITGKGLKKLGPDATTIIEAGVLRAMLPVWLSEPALAPMIAGWDVSAQQHGGDGAFYVRLRRAAR